MTGPKNTPRDPIKIEYDFLDTRKVKKFTNPSKARSFWILKDRTGKNPKILPPKNKPKVYQPLFFLK